MSDIKELKEDVKEIKETLPQIIGRLDTYNALLDIHIKGVETLDKRIKPLEMMYAFFVVFAKISVVVVPILGLLYSLLAK